MRIAHAIQIHRNTAHRALKKKSLCAPICIKYVKRYIQRKREIPTEMKTKTMGINYFLCWAFFSKTILYFPTENFFSRTRLTLYQPRITQEPRTRSKKPTRKPRMAGLKRIATPNTKQKVQKRIIGVYYIHFLVVTRKIPHFWGIVFWILFNLWKLIRKLTIFRTNNRFFTSLSFCILFEIVSVCTKRIDHTWSEKKFLKSYKHLVAWFSFFLCSVKTSHSNGKNVIVGGL